LAFVCVQQYPINIQPPNSVAFVLRYEYAVRDRCSRSLSQPQTLPSVPRSILASNIGKNVVPLNVIGVPLTVASCPMYCLCIDIPDCPSPKINRSGCWNGQEGAWLQKDHFTHGVYGISDARHWHTPLPDGRSTHMVQCLADEDRYSQACGICLGHKPSSAKLSRCP